MKKIACIFTIVLAATRIAAGHGIPLHLTSNGGIPESITAASDSPFLIYNTPSPAGPSNLFLGRFAAATSTDATLFPGGGPSYLTTSGFAGTEESWPAFTATYTVISPLLFSAGGAAVPASAGTHLELRNRFGGNSDGNHPGAVVGGVGVTGISGEQLGPAISMADTHEMAYRLYLDGSSTQTFGAYGFAFKVSVTFDGGPTIESGPLVNVFQLRDPSIAGGQNFNDLAFASLHESSSLALYNALVPEPSSWALLSLGVVGLAVARRRFRRNG